jgi:hypothetical protein
MTKYESLKLTCTEEDHSSLDELKFSIRNFTSSKLGKDHMSDLTMSWICPSWSL